MFVGLVYTVSRKLSLYRSVELEAVKTRTGLTFSTLHPPPALPFISSAFSARLEYL